MSQLDELRGVFANALAVSLLVSPLVAAAIFARARKDAALGAIGAAFAVVSVASGAARYAALLLFAKLGGADSNAIWIVPTHAARFVALFLAAAWLAVLFSRRWPGRRAAIATLVAAVAVAVGPWGLDPVELRFELANVALRRDWQDLLSFKAPSRWLEGEAGEVPARFAMGLAGDGLFWRAWACGVDAKSSVVCWYPERARLALEPLASGFAGVDVSVGAGRACVLDANGGVRCWDSRGRPLAVPALEPASALKLGLDGVACVRATGGDAICWEGHSGASSETSFVNGPWTLPVADPRLIAVGYLHAACVTTGSGAWCWDRGPGQIANGALRNPGPLSSAPALADAVDLSASSSQVCAVARSGALRCLDERGADVPLPIALEDVVQVAVGDDHSCARTRAGRLTCWGDDRWGESDESDVDDATWVSVTVATTCARRARGVECRGRGMRR